MADSSSPGWSPSPSPSVSDKSSDNDEAQVSTDDARSAIQRPKGPIDKTPPSARTRRQLGQQLSVGDGNQIPSLADSPRGSRREMPLRGGNDGRTAESPRVEQKQSEAKSNESPNVGFANSPQGGLEPYESAPPTARPTARRSSARGRRLAQPERHEQTNNTGSLAVAEPSQRSRPSGPLSSSHRERHVLNSRRDAMAETSTRQHKVMTAADLPFSVPSTYHQFPSFKGCARYDGFSKPQEPQQFFDCKFYPYTEPGVDPVFAVVGGNKTLVARPAASGSELLEILLWLEEEPSELPNESMPYQLPGSSSQPSGRKQSGKGSSGSSAKSPKEKVELNSCVWLREPEENLPFLAVSGKPSDIKIFDVTNKRLHRTLVGHGKEVNDLAVSPTDPSILASASGDHTVRIWSIDPRFDQPCIAMCAGEGHRQGLLTLAFHNKGNYILTGGVDCAVCLWALPPLPDERSGSDKPTMVHYPHFKSTAIHMSFVDCVAFHNDLILSKAAIENKIVLWRIEGFDSRDPSPPKAPVGSDGATTSAFGGKYQRLIQFKADDMTSFYIRFSVFSFPEQRSILAVGNEKSKVLFWDLDALSEYMSRQTAKDAVPSNGTGQGTPKGKALARRKGKSRLGGGDSRQESILSESSNAKSDNPQGITSSISAMGVTGGSTQKLQEKYKMNDPFATLHPHKISTVQKVSFACRQVAWSVGGEYMAVVGDQGMIGLFGRDMVWPDAM